MKRVLAILLLLAALPVLAHRGERVISQASELEPWCKSEVEARYVAMNITPYQWAASYHDSSNIFYVDGRLRVHGDDIAVRCRIARGAREEYGTIEIDDPTLKTPPSGLSDGG